MKMNLKKLMSQADDSIFDEIISGCEKKMVSPFKKEVAVEIEPEREDSEELEAEISEPSEKSADLSPEDLQKLMEMYEQLKG